MSEALTDELREESIHDKLFLYGATLIFALIVVLVFLQVIVRILGIPESQIPSAALAPGARYLIIIGTYLGSIVASRNDQHIRLEIVLDRLEKYDRVYVAVILLGKAAVIGVLVVALSGTVPAISEEWQGTFGAIAAISAGHLYLFVSIGLFMMLVYELLNIKEVVMDGT